MVDFQSRDTRRGRSDDEDEEEETDTEASEGTESDVTAAEETDTTTAEDTATEFGAETLPFAVVTVADERTIEEDATGEAVVESIEHAGDAVSTRDLVAADYDGVQSTISTLVGRDDVNAVITLGGVGVSPDDVTPDAAEPLFDKRLPGFGELYRVLSHDFDGTAIVRTRVTAGLIDGVPVFCLPDDAAGARRGVEQIVLEEADPIARQAAIEE